MDAGSANDLPAFPMKPPMKLNRQGTFKQGSNGKVDTVDISQSPRGSRSGSRVLDKQALEQIQRIKIADDVTLEQTENEDNEDEVRDQFQASLTISPRSSNGSNSSTPRPLSSAKPALILKRQGTFVQRRDGQTGHVELSSGGEIKRRLSAELNNLLHETIGDEDEDEEYEDDYENHTEDGDTYSSFDAGVGVQISTNISDNTDGASAKQHDLDKQVENVAEESPEEKPETITENSPDHQHVVDYDEEECQEDDAFPMTPMAPASKSTTFLGHNRKGTFLQSSNGKAVALDMSSKAHIASSEIISKDQTEMATCSEASNEDYASEEDKPGPIAPITPFKRPVMERKGTFIQSKNGTTKQIALGLSTGTRRVSDHSLNAISDEQEEEHDTSSESSTEQLCSPSDTDASERVRLGSLNSGDGTTATIEYSEQTSTPDKEQHDMVPDFPLLAPEPLLQRKTTYIQAKSGHTDTLIISTKETFPTNPISAAFEIIEEDRDSEAFPSEQAAFNTEMTAAVLNVAAPEINQQDQEPEPSSSVQANITSDQADPKQPDQRVNSVDPSKPQAIPEYRKETFAANENKDGGTEDFTNIGTFLAMGRPSEIADSAANENDTDIDNAMLAATNAAGQDIGDGRVNESDLYDQDKRVQHQEPEHIIARELNNSVNAENERPEEMKQQVVARELEYDLSEIRAHTIKPLIEPIQRNSSDNHIEADDSQDWDDHRILSDGNDLNRLALERKRDSLGKEEKRVQISNEVVIIESVETVRDRTTRPIHPHHTNLTKPEHNIQKMLETAERDRQYRTRQLRKLEKNRLRSRSLQQTTLPRLLMTPIRMQTMTPDIHGLELKEKFMRPTSAERFIETYRVYAAQPVGHKQKGSTTTKKKGLELKGHGQRRASSTN